MEIQSHRGSYNVRFDARPADLAPADLARAHIIIDARVADLHRAALGPYLARPSVLALDVDEHAKSLERFPAYVAHLVKHEIRRDQLLIAIGGGVVQDITCFLAANLLRGIDWLFLPTTLLAQADSCIGSKSSINCADAKNILGNFLPPRQILICPEFLPTLSDPDRRSGIGEILKVHAIAGPEAFDALARDYDRLLTDPTVLERYLRAALAIKQRYIEEDEFDRGIRNIFNFGHTFGHAIEAATDYAIPHGIAVTIGMDMAGHLAVWQDRAGVDVIAAMRPVLRRNYHGFERVPVPLDPFLAALAKDKKNIGSGSVTAILPDRARQIGKVVLKVDQNFRTQCRRFLDEVRPS